MDGTIYKHNTVDVLDAGSLRHGRVVVDVANVRFVRGFSLPRSAPSVLSLPPGLSLGLLPLHGQSRTTIALDTIHREQPDGGVEVLVRATPSQPFTWIPASVIWPQPAVLEGLRCTALVEYSRPGIAGGQRELVPTGRLRIAAGGWLDEPLDDDMTQAELHKREEALGQVCVSPGRFVVHRVPLPSRLRTMAPPTLLAAMETQLESWSGYHRAVWTVVPAAVEGESVVCVEKLWRDGNNEPHAVNMPRLLQRLFIASLM
ncbi:uncharacterized protein LOC129595255 [Paramacrobiotus metropolitanus]|uniref:uncharacterized protein LOC129595255 n=1 Tax=Paramacrobiotus metropolitanus TaxID=2943436 RepID=UPI0024464760|nr:uncharacterized protein LOC129595255 [Paramacrobiotus metropolitanus]